MKTTVTYCKLFTGLTLDKAPHMTYLVCESNEFFPTGKILFIRCVSNGTYKLVLVDGPENRELLTDEAELLPVAEFQHSDNFTITFDEAL